jgi:hypothetical protein
MKAVPCKLLQSTHASPARNFLAPIAFHPCNAGEIFLSAALAAEGLFLGEQSMSRVPWHLFQDRQPQAHLIVAAVAQAAGPVGGDELSDVQLVLKRLVTNQKPAGDYIGAATVVREAGRPEVYLAFDDEGDARKFAAAVKAKATGSYPGWASQRAFRLDGAKLTALAASLLPPRIRPKKLPSDESPLPGRIRRRPWTPITHDD